MRSSSGRAACAATAPTALTTSWPTWAVGRGIVATELSSKRQSEPTLSVRFDPRIVPESEVVSALASALGALPDPVYDRPLEVRYLDQ